MTEGVAEQMGLRGRKRLQQRADLLLTASRLFRSEGYEKTRMEDIAAATNVSPKTVYNYFPTKSAILFALQDLAREQVRREYEKVATNPPAKFEEALVQLCLAHLGEINGLEDKKLWRELMAAKMRDHEHTSRDFEATRKVYTSYIIDTLYVYKNRNVLDETADLKLMAEIVFAMSFYNFRAFCAVDDEDERLFRRRVRKQMRSVGRSWLTLNNNS